MLKTNDFRGFGKKTDAFPSKELATVGKTTDRRESLIHDVLVGGNHLALLIGADHPPYTATTDEAMEHYYCVKRQPDLYETWCCWRAIMRLARHDITRGEA